MPTRKPQPSFAGGVIADDMQARVDTARYDIGLKIGRNVVVHAHGGVSNRMGTEMIIPVMDHDRVHTLLPFERDDNENYVLVMGQNEMKVIDQGAPIQDGGADLLVATPFTARQGREMDYIQSVDVVYFAHEDVFPQKMSRLSLTDWQFSNILINPQSGGAPGSLTVTPENAGSVEYTYRVTSVKDGAEGVLGAEETNALCQDLNVDGAKNVLQWPSTGADEYNVYRSVSGIFGFIGYTDALEFTDDNIIPNVELTPVKAAGIFGAPGEYPSRVCFYQQRLVYASSIEQPETVWMSRAGNFENFTRSRILRATDRLELDLYGAGINRVRGLLQLRELVAFSQAGEFTITGPDGVMDVTNPIQTQHSYSGARPVKPLVIESTALFVDGTGKIVRDLRYTFEQNGYGGDDRSIFANHYFEDTEIIDWCYAKDPHSVVWVVLADGRLLSMTYKREHQVFAWAEHDVGGIVENVTCVREDNRDVVYLEVRRSIQGQVRRFVERMADHRKRRDIVEANFLDCSITYRGVATDTVTGLDHLEGEDVAAICDGRIVMGLTVTGGQVVLPVSGQVIHVGIFNYAEIETLPASITLEDIGWSRAQPKSVTDVTLQLKDTRMIKVGVDRDRLNEMVQRVANLSDPQPLFTGSDTVSVHPDWFVDGTVVVRQDYPAAMTVLGIAPNFSIGRSG